MGWLLNTTGKMLLKKALAKYGVPKNRITPQLVDDLFPSIEASAADLAMAGEAKSTAMASAVEGAASRVYLILSGDKVHYSDALAATLRRHGFRVP